MPGRYLAAALVLALGGLSGAASSEEECSTCSEDAAFLQVPRLTAHLATRSRVTAAAIEESAAASGGSSPASRLPRRESEQARRLQEQRQAERPPQQGQQQQQQPASSPVGRRLEQVSAILRSGAEERPFVAEVGRAPMLQTVHLDRWADKRPRGGPSSGRDRMVWSGLTAAQELTLLDVIKAMCVVTKAIAQISPLPRVRRWKRRGHTGHAEAAPLIAVAFCGWQWCFYGLYAWAATGVQGFLLVLPASALAALLGSSYVVAFLRICRQPRHRARARTYLGVCVALALLEAVIVLTQRPEQALVIAGLLSAASGFMHPAAQLWNLRRVAVAGDARAIDGPTAVARAISAGFWLVCGLLLDDVLIAAPSAAELVVSVACTASKFYYPSSDDKAAEDDSPSRKLEQALMKMGASLAELEQETTGGPAFIFPFGKLDPGEVQLTKSAPEQPESTGRLPEADGDAASCDTGGTCDTGGNC